MYPFVKCIGYFPYYSWLSLSAGKIHGFISVVCPSIHTIIPHHHSFQLPVHPIMTNMNISVLNKGDPYKKQQQHMQSVLRLKPNQIGRTQAPLTQPSKAEGYLHT